MSCGCWQTLLFAYIFSNVAVNISSSSVTSMISFAGDMVFTGTISSCTVISTSFSTYIYSHPAIIFTGTAIILSSSVLLCRLPITLYPPLLLLFLFPLNSLICWRCCSLHIKVQLKIFCYSHTCTAYMLSNSMPLCIHQKCTCMYKWTGTVAKLKYKSPGACTTLQHTPSIIYMHIHARNNAYSHLPYPIIICNHCQIQTCNAPKRGSKAGVQLFDHYFVVIQHAILVMCTVCFTGQKGPSCQVG